MDDIAAGRENSTSIVIMNNSDKWIEEYLIPKLISDGKILPPLVSPSSDVVDNFTPGTIDNNNGSDVAEVVSGRGWDDDNNKNGNNVEIKSVNIKPLSVDGFMLSAPCKVEIECIDKRKPNCVHRVFLVVKVSESCLCCASASTIELSRKTNTFPST